METLQPELLQPVRIRLPRQDFGWTLAPPLDRWRGELPPAPQRPCDPGQSRILSRSGGGGEDSAAYRHIGRGRGSRPAAEGVRIKNTSGMVAVLKKKESCLKEYLKYLKRKHSQLKNIKTIGELGTLIQQKKYNCQTIDPVTLDAWLTANQGYRADSLTGDRISLDWQKVGRIDPQVQFVSWRTDDNTDPKKKMPTVVELRSGLDHGRIIFANLGGYHWVVLTGYTGADTFLVYDVIMRNPETPSTISSRERTRPRFLTRKRRRSSSRFESATSVPSFRTTPASKSRYTVLKVKAPRRPR